MTFPRIYEFNQYVHWHEANIEEDRGLVDKLSQFRDSLKEKRERLQNLSELLSKLNTVLIRAKQTDDQDISILKCEILLEEQLIGENYDHIFKSVDSIVDKLWRKNKDRGEYICLGNIQEEIKDLVRSSVVVSSQSYARDFSQAVKDWKRKFEINDIPLENYSDIREIIVEQEAKMASGYFAYHVDVVYDDGMHIEIQIYSQLNEVWRKLSHKLYEKTRLSENIEYGHGTSASRLVSLGHLLHLAECEAERLQEDL
ncbi:hypothetical protein [Vibrio parahaemolyticus]|uniref:hypothetical protein n=1 Tax=Vibrio parahaemolyticus TaxID=670 RepID=UPI00111ED0F8|nr:hypothetical protein [Vibrio parahaemolyticus]EGR1559768.1 hypothetical protein [Vibrio parahaemolyticus]EKB1969325.1 hypothetical protein [Vibrio parahaemolyticus]TOB72294.1 hypothetical protein CGK00_21470 [Vibrio parahaemolyticus]